LILCAFSGLAAGLTTRALAGGALTAASTPGATGHQPTSTHPVASPTATGTGTATILPAAGFMVPAVVQPGGVAAGHPFTVVATVVSAQGTPLAGVVCHMQAAPSSLPLFTTWPDPAVTDANGTASWSLTAPTAPPGVYTLDIVAFGVQYQADWRPSLTLTA